jgi:hypothetical protein
MAQCKAQVTTWIPEAQQNTGGEYVRRRDMMQSDGSTTVQVEIDGGCVMQSLEGKEMNDRDWRERKAMME